LLGHVLYLWTCFLMLNLAVFFLVHLLEHSTQHVNMHANVVGNALCHWLGKPAKWFIHSGAMEHARCWNIRASGIRTVCFTSPLK
jgi:hypothetical protein